MIHTKASEIPYPETVAEAHEAFNELVAHFGNGEEMSFELITCSEEETVIKMRVALDALNDTISIFTFHWSKEYAKDRACDCFSCFHFYEEEASVVADTLRYFTNLIKQKKGGNQ